jgi:hypothetical protein
MIIHRHLQNFLKLKNAYPMMNTRFKYLLATLLAVAFLPIKTIFAQSCSPDVTPPTLYCIDITQVALPTPNDSVLILATDLLENAEDNCTESDNLQFTIAEVDQNYNPIEPQSPSRTFNYGDAGVHTISLCVKDSSGNESCCYATLIIEGLNQEAILVESRVFNDESQNCQYDNGEVFVSEILVIATAFPSGNTSWKRTSETTDNIFIPVLFDIGDTNIEVKVVPNDKFYTGCSNVVDVPLTPTVPLAPAVDFPIKVSSCPKLQIDMSGMAPQPCVERAYTIDFSNHGSEAISGAYIDVTLDPDMVFQSSSLPNTLISGQTYRFTIGTIEALSSDNFTLNYTLNCNATVGKVYSSKASIYPKVVCGAGGVWTGAQILAKAKCVGNQAVMSLENVGNTATINGLEYILTEDVIMYRKENFNLNPGETLQFPMPANGSTWHISAEQVPGFPNARTYATLEGCGTNSQGNYTSGVFLQFPYTTGETNVDLVCMAAENGLVSNELMAFPNGIGNSNKIQPKTEIEYLIRFQNTGNTAVQNLIARQDLPVGLDLSSIKLGAASHPYKFNMHENGLMEFIFEDIQLPASSVNLANSQGFLSFKATPKADLPLGTVISSNMNLYFDGQNPVPTNAIFHTIDEGFLSTKIQNLLDASIKLTVFPNPTAEFVLFEIENTENKAWSVELFDVMGKSIQTVKSKDTSLELNCKTMNSGAYFFQLKKEGVLAASGQVVVR